MIFMLILMIFFSLNFILMKHPLSMGLMLLIQVIFNSLIINKLIINSWFSYILFLIMIGGMLILFIYMTSIASNEKFKFNFKLLIFTMIMILPTMLIMFTDQYKFNLLNKQELNQMFILNLNKFFMFPSYIIMFMIIIYLLITMIAVVKITNFKSGPFRQKF